MTRLVAILAALLPAASPAHHSLAGQFDVATSFELTGTVSRVDWVNPHTYLYLDVTQADGAVLTYKLESLPVAMMRKAGLSRQELLGEGRPVKVTAHPARNGVQTLGYLVLLQFADGREIQFARVPGAEDPAAASR